MAYRMMRSWLSIMPKKKALLLHKLHKDDVSVQECIKSYTCCRDCGLAPSQAHCFGQQSSQGMIAENDIFGDKIICFIIKLVHASLDSIRCVVLKQEW